MFEHHDRKGKIDRAGSKRRFLEAARVEMVEKRVRGNALIRFDAEILARFYSYFRLEPPIVVESLTAADVEQGQSVWRP